MPSANKIIIAAAGSGKTTKIVANVLKKPSEKAAIVTYTLNNVSEIKRKFYEIHGSIPQDVTIIPWFSFLLRDFIRPYQNSVYERRIESIAFVNGQSTRGIPKTNIARYYLHDGKNVYTDKISEFAEICNDRSGGLVIDRAAALYNHIYIDEIQDLAGYDLELLETLLKSSINTTLVGDHRQATFQTNYSNKNKQYSGAKIIDRFAEWAEQGYCSIEYLQESFRCNQAICDLADSIYPDFPKTASQNADVTDHDGIFIVPNNRVGEYIEKYKPQVLRYDRRTKCDGLAALNFGDSKGLTFDRVLIFPNRPIKKLIKAGDFSQATSAAKLYVAITRARNSVAFVYDGRDTLKRMALYA